MSLRGTLTLEKTKKGKKYARSPWDLDPRHPESDTAPSRPSIFFSIPSVSVTFGSSQIQGRQDTSHCYPNPKVPFSVVSCREDAAPPQPTRHTIPGCRLDVKMGIDRGKVTALHRLGLTRNLAHGETRD